MCACGVRAIAAQGVVLVKDMWRKKEGEDKGTEVQRLQLVPELKRLIAEVKSHNALLTRPAP